MKMKKEFSEKDLHELLKPLREAFKEIGISDKDLYKAHGGKTK